MDNTIQSASDISRADHDLYADRLYQLIWQLWSNVIARRAPAVPSDIVTSGRLSIPDDVDSSAYLQAISIWFQLRKIADDNIAVRNRREQEKQEGSTTLYREGRRRGSKSPGPTRAAEIPNVLREDRSGRDATYHES